MLQQSTTPKDFAIATGRQGSVHCFIELKDFALGWGPFRLEE
ncbi:hypothetical protein SynBIOSU31_00249 [Synechococcus sp. BIOS-U3-1]|nr:hypothetical protein SynBIOSU31_00249 [Synechococcus sp. BIOS-U3-1]